MTDLPVINPTALEPLFAPWDEPNQHRIRAKREGEPAQVVKGRRPSPIVVAQNIRGMVREWREAGYGGASDTSRYLLNHWFERSHRKNMPSGEEYEFRYYFCQREAIETLIYLKEVRKLEYLSQLIAEFGGPTSEIGALGITQEEDAWSRYAFKLATGAGKTKVMSLAIVWSYFHALRESDSEMAKHFVIIAPNLTVFERLKEDFIDGTIFYGPKCDPLIPPEWVGDWNLSVVLQDEAGGASTGSVLYLTNIHRLYDLNKRKAKKDAETYDWVGPSVSRAKALDTGEALRDRITSHKRILVLNDEAHHVWDPDSAWNEAITFLNDTIRKRTGGGILAQLDFSATPKDNKGQVFKHVVCDAPLGEAVDAGIVKTPIIGRGGKLIEQASDDAFFKYEQHLRIGYERWKLSQNEWKPSNKRPLLFVMCEDTTAADQIAKRLNSDSIFKELNDKTINLHTNLKGKIKSVGRGANKQDVFIESDKEISDEDLKALRKLSRELDENQSPYNCIVSVLMLREGWDVRNVTTIVPLRPYSSKANILPEQTLGRGLRRITPPGQAHELVTVVEHPAFASLYQQELAHEGVQIEIVDVEKVPRTTITIFPDPKKDWEKLAINIPQLTAAHKTVPKIEGITIDKVQASFKRFRQLPLGQTRDETIDYEGRHLFTNEIIEKMEINLPLLESGIGALSFYVKELEYICKIRGTHAALAPLLQTFFEEILFEHKVGIDDPKLVMRLADTDVREHTRATFIPLIRKHIITSEERKPTATTTAISDWKPFQVTHSERHPVEKASRTLFNLVPCNRSLELGFTKFLENASGVAAFAKNAGPQCLRIDYLSLGSRLAFYTPDFFVRRSNGHYCLVETKGREDRDIAVKARAAVAWCKSASTDKTEWRYLYLTQGVFERLTSYQIDELLRVCEPALQELLGEGEKPQLPLPLYSTDTVAAEAAYSAFISPDTFAKLPSRYQKSVEQATTLFAFFEKKAGMSFSPAFQPLLGPLDEAAKGLMVRRIAPDMPNNPVEIDDFFKPYLGNLGNIERGILDKSARNLKKIMLYQSGLSPLGQLAFCLDHALNGRDKLGGVFDSVKKQFSGSKTRQQWEVLDRVNKFRNTYIAHAEKELTDASLAKTELKHWILALQAMYQG